MRQLNLSRHRVENGPNLTALVDVVMVILIFLMLAGQFGGQTQFLKSKSAIRVPAPAGPGMAMTDLDLMISPTGDGGYVVHAGKITTGDADVLTKELAGEFRSYQAAGTNVGNVHVVLRPTKQVRYDQVIKVYQAAAQAGFSKIMFAAT